MTKTIVITGDCLEVLRTVPDASIDCVVTDPPYGLSKEPDALEVLRHWLAGDDYQHKGAGFMGKTWDSFVPGPSIWREVLRVLKPGGHACVFAGSRTVDLMGLSMRIAGFEIRDQLQWLYGTGFPKSLNVSKAIDKQCGTIEHMDAVQAHIIAWRDARGLTNKDLNEAIGSSTSGCGMAAHWTRREGTQRQIPSKAQWEKLRDVLRWEPCALDAMYDAIKDGADRPTLGQYRAACDPFGQNPCAAPGAITAPATDEAKRWEGWGTALKPAHEPIILARKPLSGTVAANVLEHGTGALNIDGCRIGSDGGGTKCTNRDEHGKCRGHRNAGQSTSGETFHGPETDPGGRWPANVIMDPEAGALLIEQSGERKTGSIAVGTKARRVGAVYGQYAGCPTAQDFVGSTGGASRFFYCAKASRAEREAGLENMRKASPTEVTGRKDGSAGQSNPRAGMAGSRPRANVHPTVKPISLMRWLVRLVCPPGGVVLDPFTGSGSTGCAAVQEQTCAAFVGIELSEQYAEIARARIEHWRTAED
jgi:DNA modification methylase